MFKIMILAAILSPSIVLADSAPWTPPTPSFTEVCYEAEHPSRWSSMKERKRQEGDPHTVINGEIHLTTALTKEFAIEVAQNLGLCVRDYGLMLGKYNPVADDYSGYSFDENRFSVWESRKSLS